MQKMQEWQHCVHWRSLRGSANDAPSLVQFLSFSNSFRQKSSQIIAFCWYWSPRTPVKGILDPPILPIT